MTTKLALLDEIKSEAAACCKCVLHQNRIKSVFSKGNPDSKLVFLGEGPGRNESEQGIPFVGRAGKLLDSMILAMNLHPLDDVYICNTVKCHPPNNRKPLPEEMDSCKPFLIRQLNAVSPKIIVTLGATATESLLGSGLGISKRRGKWEKWNDIDVMCTFHPAALLYRPELKTFVRDDLKLVLEKYND